MTVSGLFATNSYIAPVKNILLILRTRSVAWIYGDDPCNGVTIIASGADNPCGRPFTLSNGHTYLLENCGVDGFSVLNGDNSFNHQCEFSQSDAYAHCGVAQAWLC